MSRISLTCGQFWPATCLRRHWFGLPQARQLFPQHRKRLPMTLTSEMCHMRSFTHRNKGASGDLSATVFFQAATGISASQLRLLPCRPSMPADTGPSMVTRRTMRGSAVIIDGLVLRGAIVPDHHIACPPAPAHGVFQPRHVILRESGLQDFRRAHGIQV